MRRYNVVALVFCAAGCGTPSPRPATDVLARITVQAECGDAQACFVANTEAICGVLRPDFEHDTKDCLAYRRTTYDIASDRLITDERVPENLYGAVEFPGRLRLADDKEIDAELTMFTMLDACGDTARVAFRGYGDDGGMLVETDHGLAELLSPSIEMEIDDARVLIDALSGKIIGTLTAPHDHGGLYGFQFVDRDTFYFFNKDACMTAAGPGRGVMEPVTEGCAPLIATGSWENDRGLAPAEPGDADIAAKALPKVVEWFGDALPQRVSRIEGTDMIVVNPVVPCT
jgi:hypothetical protein